MTLDASCMRPTATSVQPSPICPGNKLRGCIQELKRGVSRQMLSTGSPKALWDHCLVLQAFFLRSCTSNDIYMTNGQVPETIMTWLKFIKIPQELLYIVGIYNKWVS